MFYKATKSQNLNIKNKVHKINMKINKAKGVAGAYLYLEKKIDGL